MNPSVSSFGDYRVLQLIGQGGMGAVYKVEKDRRFYALKTLLPHYAGNEARARFEREAIAAAAVDRHPNIVSIHKLEMHSQPPYIVMSYVEGKGLDQLIQAGKPWTPEQVLEFVSPLAQALDHMHRKGVIHRDLKPANILVPDSDGAPMITDFGIAKESSLETLTKTGAMLGTPGYMAPEQFASEEKPSPQMDVWAFAVIIYELLSGGELPFTGETALLLVRNTIGATPRPLKQFNESCTKNIETVLRKALSKSSEDRYESCGAFIEDFSRAVRGEVILASRESFIKGQWYSVSRKLGPAGLALLFLLFAGPLVTVVTFSDTLFQNPKNKPDSLSSLDAAAQFLQGHKDQYSRHFRQHILWELGAPKTKAELCSKYYESSILLYRSSKKRQQKQLALHFLPCYPDKRTRDRLIEKLNNVDRELLQAFRQFQNGEFQLAAQTAPLRTNNYKNIDSQLLLLAIYYKLKDYRRANEYHQGPLLKMIPTAVGLKLKASPFLNETPLGNRESTLLALFKKQRELDGPAFIRSFEDVAQDRFNELERSGSPSQTFHFHENYYALYSQNSNLKRLSVDVSHLKKMLRYKTSFSSRFKKLHLHYMLQQLDPQYRLGPRHKAYCNTRMELTPQSLQNYVLGTVFTRKLTADQLIDIMGFCVRTGIYVEAIHSVNPMPNPEHCEFLLRKLKLRPWDLTLKLHYMLNSSPESPSWELSVGKMFNEVTQSTKVPSVFRSILYFKRASTRFIDAANANPDEKAEIRKLVLEDLYRAYKLGLPRSYRSAFLYRQAITLGRSPQQIKADRALILDQFQAFSDSLERQIESGSKAFKLGDSVVQLDQVEKSRLLEFRAFLAYQQGMAHEQMGNNEAALNTLLSVDKDYPNTAFLTLIAELLKKTNKVELVDKVLMRIRGIIQKTQGIEKQRSKEIASDLENHFKNRK